MLEHGVVPPNLHFETPNPHIDWDDAEEAYEREHPGTFRGMYQLAVQKA